MPSPSLLIFNTYTVVPTHDREDRCNSKYLCTMSCNCGDFQECMRDTGICVPSPCSGGHLDRSCQAVDGSKYCSPGNGCRPRLRNGSRCQPNFVENVCAEGLECYMADRMSFTGVCQPPGGGSRPTNPDPPVRPVDPPSRPIDPPTTPVNPPQPPPGNGGNNPGGGGGGGGSNPQPQPQPPSNNNGGGGNSGGGGGGGSNAPNPGSGNSGNAGNGSGGNGGAPNPSAGFGNSNGNAGWPTSSNGAGDSSRNGGSIQIPGSNGATPTSGNNGNNPANPTFPGLGPSSTSSASNAATVGGVSLPVLIGSVIGAAALGVLVAMLIRRRRKPAQYPPHYPPSYFAQQPDPTAQPPSLPPTLSRVASPAFKPQVQPATNIPEPMPYYPQEPTVDHIVLSTIPRAPTPSTPGEAPVNTEADEVHAAPWTEAGVVSTIPRMVEVQLGPGDAELVLPTGVADGTQDMAEDERGNKVHYPTSPTL
ncbi:hypothetical protein BCR44DRAFT_1295943 [Catenaria anguillulae PL171]|uniref:Uncharacterized protein n=1 Tax=Catenaria anguillulae PL171 TaxID=765915 RepID=A0A1Y2HXE8_9FUNG|nr:hypothetical protein BCR44DRAFT_1295943 [Catenaria anguillulae PL171]